MFTVGIEEEYQLVDPATGELRSRADEVIADDWASELKREAQQTMLEVGTPVCESAAEAGRHLRRLRFQVASTAAARELVLAAAGLHPFSRWSGQRRSAGPRCASLFERYGRVMRSDHLFGMHVHVGVPPKVNRVGVINTARWFLPHLLALSASSPIYEGEDTAYASYRTILGDRLPLSGAPPRFHDDAHYRDFVQRLEATGALTDRAAIYWSIRPHDEYPTIEFRGCDVCPSVEDAAAIAALIRAIVIACVEGLLREPAMRFGESAADAVLRSEQWQAARFGLDARVTQGAEGDAGTPLRDALRGLVERLAPIAERAGDTDALTGIERILERGNGADRIRERAADASHVELVRWLAAESLVGTGMDRRKSQRAVAG